MLPELGFLSLLFATTAALLLSIVPQIGIWRNKPTLTNTAWGLSYCFGIFTSVSIGILAYSFATDDLTLEYVAAHSNSQLPTFFKVAATWGGHEGSILFWLFTLSLWLVAFAFFSRKNDRTFFLNLPPNQRPFTLSVFYRFIVYLFLLIELSQILFFFFGEIAERKLHRI